MQVVIAKGNLFSSMVVKLFTGSKWSHVAFRYGGSESDWMLHATIGGVKPEWWVYFIKKYTEYECYEVELRAGETALDKIVDEIGHKPYDYISFIGAGIQILLGLSKNPLSDPKKYKCTDLFSEFIDKCNSLDHRLKLPKVDGESITPIGVKRYLLDNPQYFKRVAT